MPTVETYTKSGSKSSSGTKLDDSVFGIKELNNELLKQAYVAYQANSRVAVSSTLTRSEVRGGGRKPWRQKGTGRARHGSIRSPIWRGGGVTFGPGASRNFVKKLPKKAKREAIKQALSDAASRGAIKIIEEFKPKDGKTREAASVLAKLKADRNVVLVVNEAGNEAIRSTNNLDYVTVKSAKYLNVFDLLNADSVIIEKEAVKTINNWLKGDK